MNRQRSMMAGILTLLAMVMLPFTALAAFSSGSTGADGAFSPTSSMTVQIPESGVLNYTTVNIPSGVTITYAKNSANTPVTILATGNVTISGAINLDGSAAGAYVPGVGGPGGFDGGQGGMAGRTGQRGGGLAVVAVLLIPVEGDVLTLAVVAAAVSVVVGVPVEHTVVVAPQALVARLMETRRFCR